MERPDMYGRQTPYAYRYPMVSIAADIVLLNLPRDGGLRVALVRRQPDSEAYPGVWALPGGFLKVEEDPDIEACVRRELREEVGIENSHLELVGIYSTLNRDPRPERVISVAYLSALLSDEPEVAPIAGTDVAEARWVPLLEVANGCYEGRALAFDHAQIIDDARRVIDARVQYGRREDTAPELLFAFLPETFTLGQAAQVMTHLKGRETDPSNFRKYLLPFVEPTGETCRTSTRNAALYRRRMMETSAPVPPSPGIERLSMVAKEAKIRLFDLFLATIAEAPEEVVRLIGRVLTAYGRHRDYEITISRAPELRVTDLGTGRPLITLRWDLRREALVATALAELETLDGLGLTKLEAHSSGQHPSRFCVETGEAGIDRLDEVLRLSRAALICA